MPDNDDQTPEGDPQTLEEVRAALKRAEKRAKDAADAAAAGQQAQRELTFLRAGVDDSSAVGKLFMKAYDGEMDVDAIKSSWSELNPGAATPPPAETPPPAADLTPPPSSQGMTPEQIANLQRSQQLLGSGATPPGEEPLKPIGPAMMDAAFETQGSRTRPNTGMSDGAANAAFSELFGRAMKGDPEALFKGPNTGIREATEAWRARNTQR